jgi:hypothetical protein
MLAAVTAGDIFEVVWASLAAGVFVSIAFSLVVLGMAKSANAAHGGHRPAAVAYGGLAVIAFATFALAVGYGVHIMLSKG